MEGGTEQEKNGSSGAMAYGPGLLAAVSGARAAWRGSGGRLGPVA